VRGASCTLSPRSGAHLGVTLSFQLVAAGDTNSGGGRDLSQSLRSSRGGPCHSPLHIAGLVGRPRPSRAILAAPTPTHSSPNASLRAFNPASALSGKAKNAAIGSNRCHGGAAARGPPGRCGGAKRWSIGR